MRKLITTKKIAIILSAVLLITAAVFVVLISHNNDTEVFRSIMIYELDGNALIEQANGVTIDAIENIYLNSGDRVRVSADSMMRLKLDNDKYIMAEANSVFTLVAAGNEKNSLTRINLVRGAITNEIQNPLSKKSVYETSTPNSVMAVRGTIYRVELYENEAGELDTRMCCFQGTVATTPILPDGSMGEEVLVHAGNEVTVYKDGTATEPDYINFETLPSQAITVLDNLNVDMTQHRPDETTNNTQQTAADAAEGSGLDIRESFSDIGAGDDEQTDDEITGGDILDGYEILDRGVTTEVSDIDVNTEAAGNNEDTVVNEKEPLPGVPGDGNADNTESQQKPGDQFEQKPDDWPEQPSEPRVYTVTFRYGDSVFATQSVAAGGKVQKPLLQPAKTGSWDFDFDGTTVNADTTIVWSN